MNKAMAYEYFLNIHMPFFFCEFFYSLRRYGDKLYRLFFPNRNVNISYRYNKELSVVVRCYLVHLVQWDYCGRNKKRKEKFYERNDWKI